MESKFEILETIVATAETKRQKMEACNALAFKLRDFDPKRGAVLAQTALDNAKELSDEDGVAQSLTNLSACNRYLGDFVIALSQAMEAVSIYKKHNNDYGQADALCRISQSNWQLGEYTECLKNGTEALAIARRIDAPFIAASALNSIGIAHVESGEYELGLNYYHEALEIYRKSDDPVGESRMYNNIAVPLYKLGKYAEALESANESLRLAKETERLPSEGYAFGTLGEIYYAMGDYEKSLEHSQKALDVNRMLQIGSFRAALLLEIAKAYVRLHQDSLAIRTLNDCLAIVNESGENAKIVKCHEMLSEIYRSRGDLEQALVHYKHFISVKDIVFQIEKELKIQSLKIRHRTDTACRDAEIHHLKNVQLQEEIAQRKHTERALRDSEERFRRLFEQSNDAIVIHRHAHIIDVNQKACELLGYTKERFLTLTVMDLYAPPGKHDTLRMLEKTYTGEAVTFETQWLRADCTVIEIEVSSCVVDKKHTIVQDLGRIIGDRKLAERQLKKATEMAEAAGRLKSSFLATISHEIRTPMNAIIGMTELLQYTALNREKSERLDVVRKNAEDLFHVINDILDFSQKIKNRTGDT